MDDEGDRADDDDDDDDDLDDAQCDDGDGGNDSPPPSGREFLRRNLPVRKVFLLSVVSVAKRWQKNSTKWLPDNFRSRGVSTPEGSRRRGP